MGRRSDHNREELFQLFLDHARRIVEEQGLAGLTARGVADAVGYSPGTLYNLFANLDDLVLQVNARTLDGLRDDLMAAGTSGDAVVDLQAFAAAYLGFLERHPNLWAAVFEHRLPEGAAAPDWYRERIAGLLRLVETVLAPQFADDDDAGRAEAACVLWAGLHGICSLATSGKLASVTAQSADALASSLIVNFVAGLRGKGQ